MLIYLPNFSLNNQKSLSLLFSYCVPFFDSPSQCTWPSSYHSWDRIQSPFVSFCAFSSCSRGSLCLLLLFIPSAVHQLISVASLFYSMLCTFKPYLIFLLLEFQFISTTKLWDNISSVIHYLSLLLTSYIYFSLIALFCVHKCCQSFLGANS